MDGAPGWQLVGRGGNGVVFSFKGKAVKWAPLVPGDPDGLDETVSEFVTAARLARVQAPSFLRTFAAFRARIGREKEALVMVMELADAVNLRNLVIRDGTRFAPCEAAGILLELLWSMFVAHTQVGLLYHGDLHARNIVFTQRPAAAAVHLTLYAEQGLEVLGAWSHTYRARPLIIDFGYASFLQPGGGGGPSSQGLEDLALHRPPELYFGRDRGERGPASDVWQLGVLALTLFGQPPAEVLRPDILTDLIDLPLAQMEEGRTELVAEFLSLLDEQRLSVAVREQLHKERESGHMYGRFLNLLVVQEALGNGWFPDPADAPLYKGHCFFEAMRSFPVTAFLHAHVLGAWAAPMQVATALVNSLPGPARGLIKRMLSWNPATRPTCLECLGDPWFSELFPQRQAAAGEVYTAHARRPVHRYMFSAASKLGLSAVAKRQLEIHEHVMRAEQERLRRSVLNSPVVRTQAGVEEMVGQSLL
jgi:serine/threonine protein kinase